MMEHEFKEAFVWLEDMKDTSKDMKEREVISFITEMLAQYEDLRNS